MRLVRDRSCLLSIVAETSETSDKARITELCNAVKSHETWDLIYAIEYRGRVFYVINLLETASKRSCFSRGVRERGVRTFAVQSRLRYNTVASEYIPLKIGLGIEITCLRAIRYRARATGIAFNSITCFFFIRRVRSHGTDAPPRRIVWSHFFSSAAPPDPIHTWYRVTRSGPWP